MNVCYHLQFVKALSTNTATDLNMYTTESRLDNRCTCTTTGTYKFSHRQEVNILYTYDYINYIIVASRMTVATSKIV